jgi:hypothetical protein
MDAWLLTDILARITRALDAIADGEYDIAFQILDDLVIDLEGAAQR